MYIYIYIYACVYVYVHMYISAVSVIANSVNFQHYVLRRNKWGHSRLCETKRCK